MGGVLRDILRWLRHHIIHGLAIRLGLFYHHSGCQLVVDSSSFRMALLLLIYVPIMGAGLNSVQAWAISCCYSGAHVFISIPSLSGSYSRNQSWQRSTSPDLPESSGGPGPLLAGGAACRKRSPGSLGRTADAVLAGSSILCCCGTCR